MQGWLEDITGDPDVTGKNISTNVELVRSNPNADTVSAVAVMLSASHRMGHEKIFSIFSAVTVPSMASPVVPLSTPVSSGRPLNVNT